MPWIGAAISVGGSLLSGAMSKKSSGQAAGIQSQSADDAIAELQRQYNVTRADAEKMYATTRKDFEPFRQTGVAANQRLNTLLGLNPGAYAADQARTALNTPYEPTDEEVKNKVKMEKGDRYFENMDEGAIQSQLTHYRQVLKDTHDNQVRADYAAAAGGAQGGEGDPAYGSLLKKFGADDLAGDVVYNSGLQFGLDEGEKAINARAIAGGGYDSGATLKALTKFGNDYGSTKAADAYARFMGDKASTYGMLSGQQNVGMNATNSTANAGASLTNSVANAGQNMSNSVADLITQGGNARAAGVVAGGNAWQGASNALTGGINQYQNNQTLQQLLKNKSGSTYPYGSSGGSYDVPYAAPYEWSGNPF